MCVYLAGLSTCTCIHEQTDTVHAQDSSDTSTTNRTHTVSNLCSRTILSLRTTVSACVSGCSYLLSECTVYLLHDCETQNKAKQNKYGTHTRKHTEPQICCVACCAEHHRGLGFTDTYAFIFSTTSFGSCSTSSHNRENIMTKCTHELTVGSTHCKGGLGARQQRDT